MIPINGIWSFNTHHNLSHNNYRLAHLQPRSCRFCFINHHYHHDQNDYQQRRRRWQQQYHRNTVFTIALASSSSPLGGNSKGKESNDSEQVKETKQRNNKNQKVVGVKTKGSDTKIKRQGKRKINSVSPKVKGEEGNIVSPITPVARKKKRPRSKKRSIADADALLPLSSLFSTDDDKSGKNNVDGDKNSSSSNDNSRLKKTKGDNNVIINKGNQRKKKKGKERFPPVSSLFPKSNKQIETEKNEGDSFDGKKNGGEINGNRNNNDNESIALPDGVMPVSELFFRSTSSINNDDNDGGNMNEKKKGNDRGKWKKKTNGDDPQSSSRKNDSASRHHGKKNRNGNHDKRRYWDSLVGGKRVNAEPPLRKVELHYNLRQPDNIIDNFLTDEENSEGTGGISGESFLTKDSESEINDDNVNELNDNATESRTKSKKARKEDGRNWAGVISTNSRTFGPLLHAPSVSKVSYLSQSLYCEHFVKATSKWKVCPKDLLDIVKQYYDDNEEVKRIDDSSGVTEVVKQGLTNSETSNEEDYKEESKEEIENKMKERNIREEEDQLDVANSSLQSSSGAINITDKIENGINNGDDTTRNLTTSNVDDDRYLDSEENNDIESVSKGFGKKKVGKKKGKTKRQQGGSGKGFGNVETPPSPTVSTSTHTPSSHSDAYKNSLNRAKRRRRDVPRGSTDFDIDGETNVTLGGELRFNLGQSKDGLEAIRSGLENVVGKGIAIALNASDLGFDVKVDRLKFNELKQKQLKNLKSGKNKANDETDSQKHTEELVNTEIYAKFNMTSRGAMFCKAAEYAALRINERLSLSMENGELSLALGSVSKEESEWTPETQLRMSNEFLHEMNDDDDFTTDSSLAERNNDSNDDNDYASNENNDVSSSNSIDEKYPIITENDLLSSTVNHREEYDGPFGPTEELIYKKNDIFLGGGNGGVFADYSENGIASAPFKGVLGPSLLDATIKRSLQREPRVIAIGDVHGCIDELQALLRKCDYQPGDLVIFLGDLVSKGPDSTSVVKMAREIGAIGVRGNHDFEVIRWHQAIKSGTDQSSSSEHFQIAASLDKADIKWLYSLPWYISSDELNALFVHAGFVSGIRLGKQNPRLMTNMRSILPDGTVTSKFFNNWPWARLWDGPKMVLFGHDADRGLQQYEHAIGLDTGCVYGGRLTACILPEKRLVSVPAKRQYVPYRRKRFNFNGNS